MRAKGPVLIATENEQSYRFSAVHQRQRGNLFDLGERRAELRSRSLERELATVRRLERVDRLLDQRLAGKIVDRIALPDPRNTPCVADRRLDDDLVVDQAGERRAIGLQGMNAALQDAGDDLARFE